MMNDKTGGAQRYFEYMHLARQEFEKLMEVYPELATLSAKEMEVFELLLTDKTMVQIAQELYISVSAIHFHCKNIYKKLDVSSRRQFLIAYRELCRQ